VTWGEALPPAIVVGIALALFTQLFTYIAPRLIGAAALYGTFVAIFALLVWLGFSFQALLLGASWVRVRTVGIDEATRVPRLDGGSDPEPTPDRA
jgi:uncharacterized BrkB/YihY/UPF0761 family membrane protein